MSGRIEYLFKLRVCWNQECGRYKKALRPEAEGSLASPCSEFGLDVLAQIGGWRYGEHRTVPEMHRALLELGGVRLHDYIQQVHQSLERVIDPKKEHSKPWTPS